MIVGVLGYRYDHYSYVRNVIGKVPGIEYCKVKDLYARLNATSQIINRFAKREILSTFDFNHQFYDFNLNKVDLLHLYNGISYGRTPWVSTFETILPRFRNVVEATHGAAPRFASDQKLHKAINVLAGHACKQIIAMSDCASNMLRAVLVEFGNYREIIEKKLVVMQPPQDLLVTQFDDKGIDLSGPINFMFIGNAFFRKGGWEIVNSFKKLRDQSRYEIILTVVSDLRMDTYATHETSEDIQRAANLMQENRTWIKYFPHLPNPEVLDMMKKAHIGLLPTYADSYGYSVLEFQAAGCPVISTDVRALPEINNNEAGWMIEVPKNWLGEAIYTTGEDRSAIRSEIQKGLEEIVEKIFADRSIIRTKSEKAIDSIKSNHSREDFASRMKAIYTNAVG